MFCVFGTNFKNVIILLKYYFLLSKCCWFYYNEVEFYWNGNEIGFEYACFVPSNYYTTLDYNKLI